ALGPGGVPNGGGVISASFLKDASDTAWKDDAAIKEWLGFMDKYYPDGDKEDGNAIFGYAGAESLVQVLTQCGEDLPGRLPPDQTEGAGAVRRQRLAADR